MAEILAAPGSVTAADVAVAAERGDAAARCWRRPGRRRAPGVRRAVRAAALARWLPYSSPAGRPELAEVEEASTA